MIAPEQYEDVLQIKMCKYPEFQPATYVSAYLVDGLLIDTGPAHTALELVDFLKDKGVRIAVNTHHHEDHISANKFLQESLGIEIFAHPLAVDKINRPAKLYPFQEEVWGYPVPSQVKPLGKYIKTSKYHFEVISTQGHDRDHVCIYEKDQGWLFSGDLYFSTRPSVCRPMENQWQIIKDLKKLKELNSRILFPAPTTVVFEPAAKLEKAIKFLEETGYKIDELYNKGMSPTEIREQIFGDEGFMFEPTQHEFSYINMVESFLRKYEHPNVNG